jgi:hypothetical protein
MPTEDENQRLRPTPVPRVRIEKVRGSIPLSSTTVRDLRFVVSTVSVCEPQLMIRAGYRRILLRWPGGCFLDRAMLERYLADLATDPPEALGQARLAEMNH